MCVCVCVCVCVCMCMHMGKECAAGLGSSPGLGHVQDRFRHMQYVNNLGLRL